MKNSLKLFITIIALVSCSISYLNSTLNLKLIENMREIKLSIGMAISQGFSDFDASETTFQTNLDEWLTENLGSNFSVEERKIIKNIVSQTLTSEKLQDLYSKYSKWIEESQRRDTPNPSETIVLRIPIKYFIGMFNQRLEELLENIAKELANLPVED